MAEQSPQVQSFVLAAEVCPPLALGHEIILQDVQADVAVDLPVGGLPFVREPFSERFSNIALISSVKSDEDRPWSETECPHH